MESGNEGLEFDQLSFDVSSEQGERWLESTIKGYISSALLLCGSLEKAIGAEGTLERLDGVQGELLREFAGEIAERAGNAVEQTILLAMVGASLLATYDAARDYLEFQLDLLEMEEGEER